MLQKASIYVLLVFFLTPFWSYGEVESDTLFYEIQAEMIDQARVEKMELKEPEYFIHIQLKEDFHSEFGQLTGDNIGNFLAVMYEGEVIAPSLPTIQAKIPSGRFLIGPYKKKEIVKEVMQKILNEDG